LKLAAEAWLESHCANSSLHWNFRRRSLKKLTDCAITALKCSREIFLSRSSLNFEPLNLKVMGPTSSWNADKRKKILFQRNIDSSLYLRIYILGFVVNLTIFNIW
jgi:hypothetical protein